MHLLGLTASALVCGGQVAVPSAVLGVDPGVKGGLVVLHHGGKPHSIVTFQPNMEEREVAAAVKQAAKSLISLGSHRCFFEKVGYMPHDGGKGAFTFGAINGLLKGVLLACDIEITYVTPMLWQAEMECLSGGNKNVTKLRAQQLFPGERITHGNADALLIAEYGRRRLAR